MIIVLLILFNLVRIYSLVISSNTIINDFVDHNIAFSSTSTTQQSTLQSVLQNKVKTLNLFTPTISPTPIETNIYFQFIAGGYNLPSPHTYTMHTIWGDTLGNIYTDANYQRVFKVINYGERINSIAGNPLLFASTFHNGQLANATFFNGIRKIWGDTIGNLFISDSLLNIVVQIHAGSNIVTAITPVYQPNFIWGNSAGQLFISEGRGGKWSQNCVHRIDLNHPEQSPNGTYVICGLQYPLGLWENTLGTIFVFSANDETMWEANSTFQKQIAGMPRTINPTDDYSSLFAYYTIGGTVNGLWVNTFGKIYFTDGANVVYYDPITAEGKYVAGQGRYNTTLGDGGFASNAILSIPTDIWGDSSGNLFIADSNNYRIRKVDTNLIIHTFTDFSNSNGGAATSSSIGSTVSGLWGDTIGNLFFIDQSRCLIRKVTLAGIITTIGGTQCTAANGLNLNDVLFNQAYFTPEITGFWVDSNGDYYFIDQTNIQQVNIITNIITTLYYNVIDNAYSNVALIGDSIGNFYVTIPMEDIAMQYGVDGTFITAGSASIAGFNGDNILASTALLNNPTSVWIDSVGNLYLSDQGNHRVRKITLDRRIHTIAGTGNSLYNGDYGEATTINLHLPSYITGDDSGNLYVADYGNYLVRMLTPEGANGEYTLRTVIGDDGYYLDYWNSYGFPSIMWMNSKNRTLYVTFQKEGFNIIYKATFPTDSVYVPTLLPTIAASTLDLSPTSYPSIHPHLSFTLVNYVSSSQYDETTRYTVNTLWGDTNGHIYCDLNQQFILKVDSNGLSFTKIAGTGGLLPVEGFVEGTPANFTTIVQVTKIWGDTNGNLYYIDHSLQLIVQITSITNIVRVIGAVNSPLRMWGNTAGQLYVTEGGQAQCIRQINIQNPRLSSQYLCNVNNPRGLWGDEEGNLYFIGYRQGKLLKSKGMNQQQILIGEPIGEDDELVTESAHSTEVLNTYGIWVDSSGGIYYSSNSIEGIMYYDANTSIVMPFAGSAVSDYYGDGGPATLSALSGPLDLWGDTIGNIFIADTQNYRVRKVTPQGIIYSVIDYLSGDGGAATFANIDQPAGMWSDSHNNVYYLDQGNCAIRRVNTIGIIFAIGGTFTCGYSDDGKPANATQITEWAAGLWGDEQGNYYYTDNQNIRQINSTQNNIVSTLYYGVASNNTASTAETERLLSQRLQLELFLQGDKQGNLFLVIPYQHIIKRYAQNGNGYLGIYAGIFESGGYNGDGQLGPKTMFNYPSSIWIDSNEMMFIADQKNNRIRRIITSGKVSTIAGNGTAGDSGDGSGMSATFAELNNPCSITGDTIGHLFLADRNNGRIRMLSPSTNSTYRIHTILGCSRQSYIGSPIIVWMNAPNRLLVMQERSGSFFITESIPQTSVPTLAPSIQPAYPTILPTTSSTLTPTTTATGIHSNCSSVEGSSILLTNFIVGNPDLFYVVNNFIISTIWGDTNGNLYTDANGYYLRRITDYGLSVTTIAGANPLSSPTTLVDGMYATEVQLLSVTKIWGDTAGNLYYLDRGRSSVIQIFSETGKVQIIASITNPEMMWGNTAGMLYITENSYRYVDSQLYNCIIELTLNKTTGQYNQSQYRCGFQFPTGIWGDTYGGIYVVSQKEGRLLRLDEEEGEEVIIGPKSSFSNVNDDMLASNFGSFLGDGLWGDSKGGIYFVNAEETVEYYTVESPTVHRIAGNGYFHDNLWDGGPAVNAYVGPKDIWGDTIGNLYVADSLNYRVRKITAEGLIYTMFDYMVGDGNAATLGKIAFPNSLRGDTNGNIYFIDQGRCLIKKVNRYGVLSSFGGMWLCGNGGVPGATLNSTSLSSAVTGLWMDKKTGDAYFLDADHLQIANASQQYNVSIVYSGLTGAGANGTVLNTTTASVFNLIGDDHGNFFIVLPDQHVIKQFTGNTFIGVYAGVLGFAGYNGDNLPATEALLDYPTGLWIDSNDIMYIADQNNNRIRKISKEGIITTIAGTGNCGYNGDYIEATIAQLCSPTALTGDMNGNLFIADRDNGRVRLLLPHFHDSNFTITTLIRNNTGNTSSVSFQSAPAGDPIDLWIDTNENLYVLQNVLGSYSVIMAPNVVNITSAPTASPTVIPSRLPTDIPSMIPTLIPTTTLSNIPSPALSTAPSLAPSFASSTSPTTQPSLESSSIPTIYLSSTLPSEIPTLQPSEFPTILPSAFPTITVTTSSPNSTPSPTYSPSGVPTLNSTANTSTAITLLPTIHTPRSSFKPSSSSSTSSSSPIRLPSLGPTSSNSTILPSTATTFSPSLIPTTYNPTMLTSPSPLPSKLPTQIPSCTPTVVPSISSSIPSRIYQPSLAPTNGSAKSPTVTPILTSLTPSSLSLMPSLSSPHLQSSITPTIPPTFLSTDAPTVTPTFSPTRTPSHSPTYSPSITETKTATPSLCVTSFSPTTQNPATARSPSFRPTFALPTVTPSLSPPAIKMTVNTNTTNWKETLCLIGVYSYNDSYQTFQTLDVTQPNAGKGSILFGSPSLSSQTSIHATLPHNGKLANWAATYRRDSISRSALIPGDLNGDGYNDLFLCNPILSTCYLFFGTEEGITNVRIGTTIYGITTSDYFGFSFDSVGDTNFDGKKDMIICALSRLVCYVLFGRSVWPEKILIAELSAEDGYQISSGSSNIALMGTSVAGLGDMNNDGYDDIAIGVMTTTVATNNLIYVIYGNGKGENLMLNQVSNGTGGFRITPQAGYFISLSLSSAGDLNHDGLADLVIGNLPFPGSQGNQSAIVLFGRKVGEDISLSTAAKNLLGRVLFVEGGGGFIVSGIGDINHDGIADVLLTTSNDFEGANNAYIVTYPTDITSLPTYQPTSSPSNHPSSRPSSRPSTSFPSHQPTMRTARPSISSSPSHVNETRIPTRLTTPHPSQHSSKPSLLPTRLPSIRHPTLIPSPLPSFKPTIVITKFPTYHPSFHPSLHPTLPLPSAQPTSFPTNYGIETITISIAGEYQFSSGKKRFEITATGMIEISTVLSSSSGNIYVIYPPSSPENQTVVIITNYNIQLDTIDLTHLLTIHTVEDIGYSDHPLTMIMTKNVKVICSSLVTTLPRQLHFLFAPYSPPKTVPNSQALVQAFSDSATIATIIMVGICFLFVCVGLVNQGALTNPSTQYSAVNQEEAEEEDLSRENEQEEHTSEGDLENAVTSSSLMEQPLLLNHGSRSRRIHSSSSRQIIEMREMELRPPSIQSPLPLIIPEANRSSSSVINGVHRASPPEYNPLTTEYWENSQNGDSPDYDQQSSSRSSNHPTSDASVSSESYVSFSEGGGSSSPEEHKPHEKSVSFDYV